MAQKIDQDLARFKQIIRGRIKKQLRKYVSSGELIGRKGKDLVSIPMPEIAIPRLVYGDKQQGGVGQGDGEDGKPMEGEGQPKAGNQPGEHLLEAEISLEELADILGEELELPKIQPKGREELESQSYKYTGLSRSGPESLRHFKQTFKKALKREIIMGSYNPKKPLIIPTHEDRVYRSWQKVQTPHSRAVIFYMLDVSGSMGGEQKEIVRLASFWIDVWIRRNYPKVECRYIAHDAVAREVDQETFFQLRESGGTIISSAYKLLTKIIEDEYDPGEWNIYPFQFSDGDNWSGSYTDECMNILKEKILPISNIFCYGQVESEYGTGQFLNDLSSNFSDYEDLITAKIADRDGILGAIKTFLGKGK